jgi:hypothetical protein
VTDWYLNGMLLTGAEHLAPREAAQVAGMSTDNLTRLSRIGEGPPSTRVMNGRRYLAADLFPWIEARRVAVARSRAESGQRAQARLAARKAAS